MTVDNDDRKVIIIERESGGIGWAVAFIVLAIAIGFGVLVFMDQQSMIEYKIERALKEMKDRDPESFNGISRTAELHRRNLSVDRVENDSAALVGDQLSRAELPASTTADSFPRHSAEIPGQKTQ